MDKICFLTGPLQGATAELIGEEITLGRSPDNAICLDDESVSDRHAMLCHQGNDWVVRDLGSARGSFVRGERVLVAALRDGDRLAFGLVEAEFQATVGKLQLPTAMQSSPKTQTLTWSQSPGGGPKANAAAFKSAATTVIQLVVVVGILAGGYFAYQKFGRVDPSTVAPTPDTPTTTPLSASTSSSGRSSLPPAPASYATASASSAAPLSSSYTQLAMQPRESTTTTAAPEAATPVAAPTAPPAAPAAPATPVTPVAPAPPTAAAAAPSKPPSGAAVPVIQQAKLLLAQNRFPDAVAYLDKAIATTTDPAVATDLQPPLKQALDGQLLSLQSLKQQWEGQCKPLEDRLKTSQDKLEQDNKALTTKKDAEAKVYELPGGHWRYGYWEGHYYYSRTWVGNTRKGTGDSQAQTAIHELQIKVMMDQQDIKKQTDVVNRYRQQIAMLDQQIAPVQVRVTQMNSVLSPAPLAPSPEPAPAGAPVPVQAVSATK